ncbi:MAG: aminotransferase class I/II-fold pyridoxal phosphate-dependent enzyme [Clostridiales bacterium]|nr:aminotransferase class I/II-fold pyridoxal phosphate-dependent enzyme [Clostridiales bacterium]
MKPYSLMSAQELAAEKSAVSAKYADFKSQNLKIDMSRGKPGADQLELSSAILETVTEKTGFRALDNTDTRNYGVLGGLPECKRLFAEILDVKPENIIVGGNSSLSLMFDYISQCMTTGAGSKPWMMQGNVKFLCPAPGYDRHFSICEHFGIEMIPVPMLADGPDMDVIESYMNDTLVKGMFCVPKYSNPQGITYSDATVRRIAALKPAAKDFRIIWDNAYCVHDINDTPDKLLNIFEACEERGSEDMVIEFTSTSKISFPGAGVSVIAASENNIKAITERLFVQIISYDKINQLRHARYFKDADGIKAHMKLHASIIKPKFDAVTDALNNQLAGLDIASWNVPNGGYFVSLDVTGAAASRVGELCKDAGLKLTQVGATYPYGNDPHDRNIRIAPTFPPVDELKIAMDVLCTAVKLAALEKF